MAAAAAELKVGQSRVLPAWPPRQGLSRGAAQSFTEAVKFVREGPKPSKTVPNDRKLKIYGLYKQVRARWPRSSGNGALTLVAGHRGRQQV
jgi:hypothetical protein